MFGQTGNPPFGGFSATTPSSPFAASAFGKPNATTSFGTGSVPVFGSGNATVFGSKPAVSTTSPFFNTATTTPAFGQPATTHSSFGGFNTTNTNTNLFNTQQNANTNLFGTRNTAPAFGQSSTPSFGFPSSTSTSLFGQTQQPAQQVTPFGQSNPAGNTSLFGSTTGFGSNTAMGGMTGTVIKFTAVTSTDTMVKNGVTQNISTRHHCITCMKEYENKSLEELRLEDYTAGRKGTAQAGQTTGLFGATPQASPFANTAAGASSSTGAGFGSMTSGFGANAQTGSTSLFGKPMTGFGTPATTTSAFAFNPTTTSNLFGANPQAKPFGTVAPTSLFSSTNTGQTTGAGFGAISGAQTSGFGAFGSTPANQGLGLFNQNKPAFNAAVSTVSNGFGAFGQAAPTNTNTGFFGTKPSSATGFGTTSTFGSTTAPTFGTAAGFGTTPNTGTSLFNTSFKSTGQTPGFSFGSTPISSSNLGGNTGLTLGGGSSLFGAPKPGGLFGNSNTGASFNSSGTFGASTGFGTNTNATPGLGGGIIGGGLGTNQTQQNSGSVLMHQQILALVSSPFGDSPLLKDLQPASGKAEELLKPTNTSSRTLNNSQYKVATNNNSPKIKARAVTSTHLSKKSLFEGLEEEDPTLLEAFQPRTNTKRLVLRPKPIVSPQTQTTEDANLHNNDEGGRDEKVKSPSQLYNNDSADKENHEQDHRSNDDRRSSISWLKSSLTRKNKTPDEDFEGHRSPFRNMGGLDEALENTVSELRPHSAAQIPSSLNNTATPNQSSSSINISRTGMDSTGHSSDSSHELEDTSNLVFQSDYKPNAAHVTLRRVGYYTIPALDRLEEYVKGETCIVPNFTVARKGYGNVYFPDSFDVYGLNLDEIVHFRHKEVIIYPDDEKKPPVGQGLNRRAQVTLDKVWPHDKTLHEPITNPERLTAMNYEAKLRRVCAKHDTRFLEYRPETGSWVFKVDHFSKYGLSDSDDEDNDVPEDPRMKKFKNSNTKIQKPPGTLKQHMKPIHEFFSNGHSDTNGINNALNKVKDMADKSLSLQPDAIEEMELQSTENSICKDNMNNESQPILSPTAVYARIDCTDSHKLLLMKANFFAMNNEEVETVGDSFTRGSFNKSQFDEINEFMQEDKTMSVEYISTLRSNTNLQERYTSLLPSKQQLKGEKISTIELLTKSSTNILKVLPVPVVTPVTVVLKFPSEIIPLHKTIASKLQFHCIADCGIQMGRMFKPRWGPGLQLITLNTQKECDRAERHAPLKQLESYVSGRSVDDMTSSIVQRLKILGGCENDNDYVQMFKESIEGHLRIELDHCIIEQEDDCLTVSTGESLDALHAHCALAQELANRSKPDRLALYTRDVWDLCVALWGDLPDLKPQEDKADYHNSMVRREALSEWFKNVIDSSVQDAIANTTNNDRILLLLLSANELEEACKLAQKAGDYCLALIIAQLGGSSGPKELIKQQIALWQDSEVDAHIGIDRLKLFMLAAGIPLIFSKQGVINICEDFDWKSVLALHLWYLSPPISSIMDALELYETAFDTSSPELCAYAPEPRPEYKLEHEDDYETEVTSGKKVYDLRYHLLKLYCTGNHSLEELLNPATHSVDPLDYRLSWLVQQVLLSLGYSHISAHANALTHINFAAQLESYDLWHWAIFVVLHLKDTTKRRLAIIDLLSRHVQLDDDPEYVKREEFLREELGIPSIWINKAKSIKSCIVKRYGEAAWYLIQAEQWNEAHEVIIQHLAADAIINENYEYLKSLLTPLAQTECTNTISGWAHQGQLLWDYMLITEEMETLVRSSDRYGIGYKLELLRPQLTSLCDKINQFPCYSSKHRLCQAEIAKRTSHLARSLLLLESKGCTSMVKVLSHLVSVLPLPEDYAQQELRCITNMCINEVATH
ncbi:nuclear pore complex protein Nup98-Nup96 isoform X2 [Cephus cinctus]|uniref:Nuclear pore complex protein Nup98-Nup96 n=1 Tax=Cephus cinctus TaxID=211228 RepID=A0AAJ7FPR1_CEPCN|nr:nuclear pore complex protein Nup98-Nup96 isoform X2 [Cephus cinctus]